MPFVRCAPCISERVTNPGDYSFANHPIQDVESDAADNNSEHQNGKRIIHPATLTSPGPRAREKPAGGYAAQGKTSHEATNRRFAAHCAIVFLAIETLSGCAIGSPTGNVVVDIRATALGHTETAYDVSVFGPNGDLIHSGQLLARDTRTFENNPLAGRRSK